MREIGTFKLKFNDNTNIGDLLSINDKTGSYFCIQKQGQSLIYVIPTFKEEHIEEYIELNIEEKECYLGEAAEQLNKNLDSITEFLERKLKKDL